jgi:hypothetical protein
MADDQVSINLARFFKFVQEKWWINKKGKEDDDVSCHINIHVSCHVNIYVSCHIIIVSMSDKRWLKDDGWGSAKL